MEEAKSLEYRNRFLWRIILISVCTFSFPSLINSRIKLVDFIFTINNFSFSIPLVIFYFFILKIASSLLRIFKHIHNKTRNFPSLYFLKFANRLMRDNKLLHCVRIYFLVRIKAAKAFSHCSISIVWENVGEGYKSTN